MAMDELRVTATGHGLNYLPEYHAAFHGRFAALGLSVVSRVPDPWTGVLDDLETGDADVALGGLWVPAMYAGMARDLVVVGQLNGRFPMVVLTRQPVPDFEWSWMRGRTVLAPGAGGTAPYEFTAGLMREAGADPGATRFVRDLSSAMLTELYLRGLGDAMVCDLLSAHQLIDKSAGSIAFAMAVDGGPMPNSVYYVRADRVDELRDRLVRFMVAIGGSMTTLNAGGPDEVEDLVSLHWPDVAPSVLHRATAQLIATQTWDGIRVDVQASDRWVAMLRTAGLVGREASFDDFVDMSIVDEAEARHRS